MLQPIKDLIKNLRYLPIDRSLERSLTIRSTKDIGEDIAVALSGDIPFLGKLLTPMEEIQYSVERWGVMDLTFNTAGNLPTCPVLSTEQLIDLSLVPSPEDAKGLEGFADGWKAIISQVTTGAREGNWFVKLLLSNRGFYKKLGPKERFSASQTNPVRFPAEFYIDDACLSNSEDVWTFKHFRI